MSLGTGVTQLNKFDDLWKDQDAQEGGELGFSKN
jgi:hypothetical protein